MSNAGPFVQDGNGHPVVAFLMTGTTQNVAYTGTAGTITNGVGASTKLVRVVATTACYIAVGTAPTATTNDVYLPADKPEIIRIVPGHKVSAIQAASGGTLIVTELT